MSEMIKSSLINCFSMLEERSFFSFLLPHPPPPFPHVFPSVSVGSAGSAKHTKHTWSQVFGITLDVPSYLSTFLPFMGQKWDLNMNFSGWGPQTTPFNSVVWGLWHMWNVHRVGHWLSRQTHAWPCALESGSTRQVSDRLPQDLNGFKILIYCPYVCVQEVKILRQS